MPQLKPKSQQQSILNPPALAKTDLKAKQILETLRVHWELGREISDGNWNVKEFAIKAGIDERTVRDRRTFYKEYSCEEFEKFRDLRLSKSKLPLDSGYIRYLVTIKGPVKGFADTATEARYAFAVHAAKNDLSPAELHDLIKRQCGRPKSSHGGKHRPRDKATAIERSAREAKTWISLCEAAINFVRGNSRPSQRMVTLLRELSQWTSNAAELCEVPKDNEEKSESLLGSMKSSREKILAMHSNCIAKLKVKNA